MDKLKRAVPKGQQSYYNSLMETIKKAKEKYYMDVDVNYKGIIRTKEIGRKIIGRPKVIVECSIPSRSFKEQYEFDVPEKERLYPSAKEKHYYHNTIKRLFSKENEVTVYYGKPGYEFILGCVESSIEKTLSSGRGRLKSEVELIQAALRTYNIEVKKEIKEIKRRKDGKNRMLLLIFRYKTRNKEYKYYLTEEEARRDDSAIYYMMYRDFNSFLTRKEKIELREKRREEIQRDKPSHLYPSNATERNEKIGNERGKIDKELEIRMIREECEETCQAIELDDKKEVIDGCIDLIFVLFGTLHKTGLSPKHIVDAYNAVCDSNNSKTGERFANGKIKKGKKFVKPDFSNILKEIGSSAK